MTKQIKLSFIYQTPLTTQFRDFERTIFGDTSFRKFGKFVKHFLHKMSHFLSAPATSKTRKLDVAW